MSINLPRLAGLTHDGAISLKWRQTCHVLQVADTSIFNSQKWRLTCRGWQVEIAVPKSDGWPAEASRLLDKIIFMGGSTSQKRRLTCQVLQVTEQWLKKVLATPKTDGWPARFCRSFNWPLTCHIWQVYPQEILWINLPASAGQRSLFPPAVYGRNSQVTMLYVLTCIEAQFGLIIGVGRGVGGILPV